MKAQIKAGESARTHVWEIIGKSMYVEASGKDLPQDFIIIATNKDGRQFGVRPVQGYQEARGLVKKLNALDRK